MTAGSIPPDLEVDLAQMILRAHAALHPVPSGIDALEAQVSAARRRARRILDEIAADVSPELATTPAARAS